MTKKYSIALVAAAMAMLALPATAQNKSEKELNKVITLDKDFVPVEKKAVKKNNLPQVKKTEVKDVKAPGYSSWTRPTIVPSLVPTMEPYGYHTRHHFSRQNGYLVAGAGSQLNLTTSVGYRIIDTDSTYLAAWLQHNSTWNGKNGSALIPADMRQKQRFNDNLLGVDLKKVLNEGTLGVAARAEFDSFNYYGGYTDFLRNTKQSFYNVSADGTWESTMLDDVLSTPLDYRVNFGLGFAGYGKGLYEGQTGAREFQLRFGAGADYAINDISSVGGDFKAAIVRLNHYDTPFDELVDQRATYGLFKLSPYYKIKNERVDATLGLNIDFSMNDGAAVRFSPNVKVDVNITDGVVAYANALGGKWLNTLAQMHESNRYSAPRERYESLYTPLDLEGGFKFGPFRGFSIRVFAGYGFFRGALDAYLPITRAYSTTGEGNVTVTDYRTYPEGVRYAATHYRAIKYKGVKLGAELNWKLRNWAELKASVIYAPTGDDEGDNGIDLSKYRKGYSLNYYDGTCTAAKIDLNITPISALAINLGVDYRGNRAIVAEGFISPTQTGFYDFELDDVWNLHAGASYRFSAPFSVWLEIGNILNRKWDEMPGMSAQKFNIMGGVAFNF